MKQIEVKMLDALAKDYYLCEDDTEVIVEGKNKFVVLDGFACIYAKVNGKQYYCDCGEIEYKQRLSLIGSTKEMQNLPLRQMDNLLFNGKTY